MDKDRLNNKRDNIVRVLSTGMIFTNRKTDFCVELNICPLMNLVPSKGDKTKYVSPSCKSCYATDLLNISRSLRKKIQAIPAEKQHLIDKFEEDVVLMKQLATMTELGEITRLRFYGLTDFAPDNIPFILAAAKHLTVDVISKSLTMPHNEAWLKRLINAPNVWISLSFNKNFQKPLARIKELLREMNACNVQLNYCLHTKEENPSDKFYDQFQVIHQRDQNKWNANKKGVDESRICGLYDRDGNYLEPKAKGAHCHSCNNCHVSYVEAVKA